MNLGQVLGAAVRESIPARASAISRFGQIAGEQTREVLEALVPIRYEMWQTAEDERTCPICGQLSGEIWPEGEGFTPPVHDHCRCRRVYRHTEFRRR